MAGHPPLPPPHLVLFFLLLSPALSSASGIARILFLVQQPPLVLTYHGGLLLKGSYALNLIWYGSFTLSQRTIISDFVLSLSPPESDQTTPPLPSVASWWKTTEGYKQGDSAVITLGWQQRFEDYQLGRSLTLENIQGLASLGRREGAINVVLTAADVSVDGFCMSHCGVHDSVPSGESENPALPYIWVGNSAAQCPGQCAWPFAQPYHGPQAPPLKPPNGDVGVDGMVVNLATLLAGAVTNPFDSGYFQGPATAPMEAVSACTGAFGKGAYPGNPGSVPVDLTTGASYNADGSFGRKYLLPAMWDPATSQCATLV